LGRCTEACAIGGEGLVVVLILDWSGIEVSNLLLIFIFVVFMAVFSIVFDALHVVVVVGHFDGGEWYKEDVCKRRGWAKVCWMWWIGRKEWSIKARRESEGDVSRRCTARNKRERPTMVPFASRTLYKEGAEAGAKERKIMTCRTDRYARKSRQVVRWYWDRERNRGWGRGSLSSVMLVMEARGWNG
jgi:hypothetical protein